MLTPAGIVGRHRLRGLVLCARITPTSTTSTSYVPPPSDVTSARQAQPSHRRPNAIKCKTPANPRGRPLVRAQDTCRWLPGSHHAWHHTSTSAPTMHLRRQTAPAFSPLTFTHLFYAIFNRLWSARGSLGAMQRWIGG